MKNNAPHKDLVSITKSPPPPPLFGLINRNDQICLREIERAKSDAKKGILVYSFYGVGRKRYTEELEEVLKKFNIRYEPLGMNCLGDLNCYGIYMDSLISVKYGKPFIKQVSKIADHMFQARWETKIYQYWHLEAEPRYGNMPADSFIIRKLVFPKGWDFKPMEHERQFIDAELVIDTLGAVSNIKVGDFSYNLKSSNEKYLGDLKNEIKGIIEKMEPWQPARLNGHKVKCWYLIDINLDKDSILNKN